MGSIDIDAVVGDLVVFTHATVLDNRAIDAVLNGKEQNTAHVRGKQIIVARYGYCTKEEAIKIVRAYRGVKAINENAVYYSFTWKPAPIEMSEHYRD